MATGKAERLTLRGMSWIPGWDRGGNPRGGGLGAGPGLAAGLEPDPRVNANIHMFPPWGLGPECRKQRRLLDAPEP